MYDHLCNTSADINSNRAADADDEGDIVIYIGADIYTGLMTSDCAPLQMQILPPSAPSPQQKVRESPPL